MTRTPWALLILALVSASTLSPAFAADNCTSAPARGVVNTLQGAASTQGAASSQFALPSGNLSAADLASAFEHLKSTDQGIAAVFGLFADGQKRVVPGNVVRDIFQKNNVKLDFLPIETLREIRAENGKVTFSFDFGGDDSKTIRLPDSTSKQLDSRLKSDPLKVDPKNKVIDQKSEGKTLKVNKDVEFSVSKEGITALREGDIKVKALLWFSLGIHTEKIPGKVAMDESRTVLATDSSGNPQVRDGHYVAQSYDDWVILEAGGKRIEIGVPKLSGKL